MPPGDAKRVGGLEVRCVCGREGRERAGCERDTEERGECV